ncbi:MAG: hypothetical protein PWP71_2148 [Clostridia bacterium]|jgi:superfamily II DNA or RNA helicase|nr:hypothetical protein [Clostridia bacterium]
MSFTNLDIKREYRSLSDNIIRDFYLPLLSNAIYYKRAVGFFSSSALIEISKGITGLVRNGGSIQLIASPRLHDEDIKAIYKGYEEREKVIERAILREFDEPKNYFDKERLNLLATLIASGTLELKIAFTLNKNNLGIFHEKMGLIFDSEGNKVVFSGSMNESLTAFSDNYESIDVFCSWKTEFEKNKVSDKISAFEKLWNDIEPNVKVIEFPKVAYEKLQTYKQDTINLFIDEEEAAQSLVRETNIKYEAKKNTPTIPSNFSFYDYQLEAINEWARNGYRGIFDMATGTGKTYTGLGAIVNLYNKCNGNLAVIIVCPYQHLVEQWVEDIVKFNIDPIVGYSNSSQKNYRKNLRNAVFDFNINAKKFFCFICTNATFKLDYIQNEVTQLKGNVLLLVDEAHNFGAMGISQTLKENYKYRLALSATLERHNDDEGTEMLKSYFGKKCIEYPLERAIREGKLAPYYYYPKVVTLSPPELEQYNYLTNEIGKCLQKDKFGKTKLSEKGKKLALKRARLVAGAIGKVDLLLEIMESYKNESHILVYCGATKLLDQNYDDDIEDIRQIDLITKKLWETFRMKVSQFTSKENNQERAILKKAFEDGDSLQALIAIKCLDEGVNIPKIKTAFILASTTNPKEYIQRRGRVLRLAEGKEEAVIYDFITLPRPLDEVKNLTLEQIQKDKSLIKNELNRIIEFKDLSKNPIDGDRLISEIYEAYELDKDNFFDNLHTDSNDKR